MAERFAQNPSRMMASDRPKAMLRKIVIWLRSCDGYVISVAAIWVNAMVCSTPTINIHHRGHFQIVET